MGEQRFSVEQMDSIMRLNNYLTEVNLTPIQLYKKIQKECSQIIKLYQKENRVFYRGVTSYPQWWKPKKVRIRSRIPKDTPKGTHLWLNDYFKKRFGWPGRNGVLATPRRYTANYYAGGNDENVYVFCPVNRYKFIYNPEISDLYDTLPQELKRPNPNLEIKLDTPEEAEKVYSDISGTNVDYFNKRMKKYTDKNLKNALTMGVEVMFNTKQYYLLPIKNGEYKGYPFDIDDILGFEPIQ